MSELFKKIAIVFATTASAVVAYRLAVLGWHGALCKAPVISDPAWKHEQLAAGPCWEYWLNRYQTFIGALAALGAAALAWRGVQSQISLERAREVRQDLDALVDIRERFAALMSLRHVMALDNTARHLQPQNVYTHEFRLQVFDHRVQQLTQIRGDLDATSGAIRRIPLISPAREASQRLLDAFWSCANAARNAYHETTSVLKASTGDFDRRTIALSLLEKDSFKLVDAMQVLENEEVKSRRILNSEIDEYMGHLARLTRWMRRGG